MIRKFTLLYLLLLPAFLFAKENPDHFVRSKDGFYFIVHHVRSQENLFQIAKIYNLKPAVLAKFNDITYSTPLTVNEIIDIPLTETNYFKLANLGEENGFIRVYYRLEQEQSVDNLCDQFQLLSETFCNWNKVQPTASLKTGTSVMIGWLMYQRETGALSTSNSTKEENAVIATPTIPQVTENKTAAKKMAKGKEPTLSNSVEKAFDKITTTKKENKAASTTQQTPAATKPVITKQTPVAAVKNPPQQTTSTPSPKPSPSKGHATAHPSFKDDTRDFWNKVKSAFQRKPKNEPIAQAGPIRKDPNRQSGPKNQASDKEKISLKQRWNRLVNGPEPTSKPNKLTPAPSKPIVKNNSQTLSQKTTTPSTNDNSPQTAKPTLKERWNRLVNGPEPAKPAKHTTTTTSKTSATKNETVVKNTITPKEKTATEPKTKPTLKERWNRLVNGPESVKPIAKKVNSPVNNNSSKPTTPKPNATVPVKTNSNNTVKPVVKNQTVPIKTTSVAPKPKEEKKSLKERWNNLVNGPETTTSKTATSTVNPTVKKIKPDVEKTEKPIVKKTATNPISKTNATNANVSRQPESKITQSENVAENSAPKEVITAKETAIHSEVKSLSLTNSKTVKAAYFFSGPSGGKFYAVTNLVTKGNIIKLINPANGRSIMAEVIGNLSPIDLNKGLIIKVSDNAKLALGQKNAVFTIKVNY